MGQGSNETLRVAVVGVGNAGRQHIDACRDLPNVEVVVVVDPDFSAAHATGLAAHDLDGALALDVDVVAVCTPPDDHAAIVSAAVRSGRHVLVEKPPARTTAEFDTMVITAAQGDVLAAVMLQHRFVLPVPPLTPPAGLSGAKARLRVSRPRPESHYVAAGWRSDPRRALGGITAHLGVHYLDLACQLLGEPTGVTVDPRAVAVGGIDLELEGQVEFERGGVLEFSVTSRSPERTEQLEVRAEGIAIRIVDGAVTVERRGRTETHETRAAQGLRGEVYSEVAAAVRGDRHLTTSSLAGARGVTRILERVAEEVMGR